MIALHSFFDSIWKACAREAVPILAAVLAALVGGAVSAFLVHWLTRTKGHEAARDSDNEEWRELLSALIKIEMHEADSKLPVPR